MLRVPRVYYPSSLEWDLDIGKILFASSFIKQSKWEIYSISFSIIIIILDSFVYNLNPKCYIRRLWPKVKTSSISHSVFDRKGFHTDVVSSLKLLSQTYCGPVYDICRLQTADCRLQTADCRPQTADRIDKVNSINSDVIINNISRAK